MSEPAKYYFIVYENRKKGESAPQRVSNVITTMHPLVWAATGIAEDSPYHSYYITVMHWWVELPADVALDPRVLKKFSTDGVQLEH